MWWRHFSKRSGARLPTVASPAITTDETHVVLGKRVSIDALLAALRLLPRPGILFIEGGTGPGPLDALAEYETTPQRSDLSGTVSPSQESHFPLTTAVIDGLQALAECHAVPELMDHLVAYNGEHVLLAAYDAGSDPIVISRRLPPEVRQEITRLVEGVA
jgi:hypothetical protein